jgi:hypothetical protein
LLLKMLENDGKEKCLNQAFGFIGSSLLKI